MKSSRILAPVLLSLSFSFSLLGCGEPPVDVNTLPASEQPAGAEIRINELPYSEMRYNSTSISLENVEIYQLESNYEYSAFVVASYNISKCSDADRHWLFEQGGMSDNDFDVVCYLESAKTTSTLIIGITLINQLKAIPSAIFFMMR